MSVLKPIYKVVRSIVISVIVLLVVIYAGLYVLLSLPSVQNKAKDIACKELSPVLGGNLNIGSLNISPFSELVLRNVALQSPSGEEVARIDKVAAGIDISALFFQRRIILNYAEIIGLNAQIFQWEKDGPTNIQFLINALSPKDKSKPTKRFDIAFRNAIIRKSKVSFSRPWMINDSVTPKPFSELSLDDLRLDLSIPIMKNDLFKFDIRKLQAKMCPGVDIKSLSADITYKKGDGASFKDKLNVENLEINLPNSSFAIGDIEIDLGGDNVVDAKAYGYITPTDFSEMLPMLSPFDTRWDINLDSRVSNEFIEVNTLNLDNDVSNSFVKLKGRADGLNSTDSLNVCLEEMRLSIDSGMMLTALNTIPKLKEKTRKHVVDVGNFSLNLAGELKKSRANASGEIITPVGAIQFEGNVDNVRSRRPRIVADLRGEDVDLGKLLSVATIGTTSFNVIADVKGFDKNVEGEVEIATDYIKLNGRDFNGLSAYVEKYGKDIHASVAADDVDLQLDMEADLTIDGSNSTLDAYLDLGQLNTEILGIGGKLADSMVGFNLDAHTIGTSADNLTGFLHVSDLNVTNSEQKELHLDNLSINIENNYKLDSDSVEINSGRTLILKSDIIDAKAVGQMHPGSLVAEIKDILSSIFPSLIKSEEKINAGIESLNDFTFDIEIKGKSDIYDFLDTQVCPLTEIPITGYFNSSGGKLGISMSTPHLRQGKDKLIRDTSLKMTADSFLGVAKIDATIIYPAKKGDVQLGLEMSGVHDKINANVILNPTLESSLKGNVGLKATFGRIPNPVTGKGDLSIHLDIIPSAISIKETIWNIANGKIDYFGKNVSVRNFLIEHEDQYIKINGTASENPDDILSVRLNDIDLDYIFSILNINYVTFGGMATGEVVGSQILTKTPVAHTKFLRVKGLSYNGATLGDGNLASTYFSNEQKVGIYAVINDPLTRERRASIDGGIWVTRDSLSFTFDANKVNLQLMKPFVSAFCSDLNGFGSGKCKLYGSFSDIDLVGNLRADTISMKIDFTNTWYHAGGDSVVMGKGLIDIPPLTLYDSEGHTAVLSGWLRHRYFHEPEFCFKIRDAKSILCYDTNEKLNPLWYGTIYASGNGQIAGRPGIVEIDMNMTTDENSKFFYVISDAEDTGGYSFLTFTDKRKERMETAANDSVPDYLHQFMKKVSATDDVSSNVVVSLKGTVTNDALLTLVMDPIAGDKITARGQGAMQMDYNMAASDLRMIGTYILDEGNYYFTLQDIIIRNFNIKQGSSIRFDGDPMNATLDITATYRVNTNLTDLDQSFAQDKELNRTNVPVDAILLVDGPMTHPDIDFDIELPTLTSDVERKVKSIVSTNDMMSRQIIYLLALNRFYTQEYSGGTSNSGAEWSSMASSTISSQLSNILSSMTDKLSVAPSFRSDKGDFSDMEFDLALSSRLLNNRLLINGNFGYRDRQTSNTQFVGDFDIEYLLNKNGNLRLKAYNHFNDQNYYLRSALTTQGVGVVFRRDFDHLFNLGKKKSPFLKDRLLIDKEQTDSTSQTVLDVKPMETQTRDSIQKHRLL